MTGPRFLQLTRRWWWLIALGAVTGGLVAGLIASHAAKTYQAESKLLVGPVSGDFSTLHASGQLGKTYAELATSGPVVEAAAHSAGLALESAQLERAVTADSNEVTRIIDIRVRQPSPLAAARLANAVGAQLMRLRRRLPVEHVDAAKSIAGDPSLSALNHAQREAVRAAVGRLDWSSTAGDLAVVQRAVASPSPVGPKPQLLVLLAALAGALAAVMWASVQDATSRAAFEEGAGDDFQVESFLPPLNGADGGADGADLEQWLDKPRAQGLR